MNQISARTGGRESYPFATTRFIRYTLVILGLLLLVRILLPYGVEWYVNRQLDASPNYEGSIGNVDLHLYRGAYSIDDITISKVAGDVPVPLLSVDNVDLSVLWSALLRGALVASVVFESPVIYIVDSEREENRQTGTDGNWLTLLDDLVPLRIDEMQVHNGAVHFSNFDVQPPVDVQISDLELVATNLTNSQKISGTLVGEIRGEGTVAGGGQLEFSVGYDPESEYPTFDLAGRISDVPLMSLDDLIAAYAPFDIEAGAVSMTTEIAAADGAIEGYIKPLITELKVFEWHGDIVEDQDNPFRAVWEALVGFVGELLQNQEEDQLATLVEIEGRFDQPETDNWSVFVNILRNAFIEAFNLDFENTVSLDLLRRGDSSPSAAADEQSGESAADTDEPEAQDE